MLHRIRRLRWRVTVSTHDEAFSVRARLRRMLEDGLPGQVERAFDVAVGDQVVYLSRLELTLRVGSVDEIASALAVAILESSAWPRSASASVKRARPPTGRSPVPIDVDAAEPLDSDLPTAAGRDQPPQPLELSPAEDRTRPRESLTLPQMALAAGIHQASTATQGSRPSIETASASEERAAPGGSPPVAGVEALIQYLVTGLLPWPLANIGREQTLALLIEAATEDPDRILAAVPRSQRAIAFLSRWIQLLPESRSIDIARRIESVVLGVASGLGEAVASLVETHDVVVGHRHGRSQVRAALLAIAIRRRTDSVGRSSVEDAKDVEDPQDVVSAIISAFETTSPAMDLSTTIDRLPLAVANWIRRQMPELFEVDRTIVPTPGARDADAATSERSRLGGVAPSLTGDGARRPWSEASADSHETVGAFGFAVDHAGLVLLHPFLPRLFERTGVLRSGEASLGDALPRAAALLCMAARGVDEPFEFELGFVKVLLGLRPDTDLPLSSGLVTPTDREEIDSLLESVIEHWRVLKHTSIAGLRRSLLQRPGLLAEVDGAWQLRVEPHAFDVLLDYLPWSISTVKLPWMTTSLFTEWPTP